MIGVLRPQQCPSGSRDSRGDGVVFDKKSKKDRKAPQFTAEANHADRHPASLESADQPNVDTLTTSLSSPELLGDCTAAANCDCIRSSGDEGSGYQQGKDHFLVAVIQSVEDGHQIQELDNNAEIGTLCVAVVRQSSKEVYDAVLDSAKTGIVANSARLGNDPADRVSALSAGATVLRKLLLRPVEACSLRRGRGGQHQPVESLVLFCKLPGGVIMTSPLGGPAFRLRRQDDTVNGTNAQQPGNDRQQFWTLPLEGFEALRDLENSVAPGLPGLARDMAKDTNILESKVVEFTRHVAEDIHVRLSGDGHHDPKCYVVVPHTAGIAFASLDPGAACPTARRGTISINSGPVPATLVMARLEQGERSGPRGTMVVQQRFVLESLDVFCGEGGGNDEEERGRCSTAEREEGGARNRNRRQRSRTVKARRVSMPVTYAALLEEATLPSPSTGPSFASRIWSRWRKGHAYRAGGSQVVPGIGEDMGSEHESWQTQSRTGQRARLESPDDAGGVPTIGMATPRRQTDNPRQLPTPQSVLNVRDVQSASLDHAATWASNKDVIRALLAAACRPGADGSSTAAETQAEGQERSSSCAEARCAACILLERVFGNGMKEKAGGEDTTVIGGEKASVAIDQWYQGFCSVTAPICGGGEGVGGRQDQISCLVLHEAPRLLLQGMLETPVVKSGFVERGLAQHLAEVLRTPSGDGKKIEQGSRDRCHKAYPRSSKAPAPGVGEPLTHEPEVSSSYPRTDERDLQHENRDADTSHVLPRANRRRLPWWLLFSHGEDREEDTLNNQHKYKHYHENQREHEHGPESAAIPAGSADGRSTSEIDGRSCMTTLDELSVAGGETKDPGPDTGREFDPVSARDHDVGHDDATGDNSLASVGTAPTSDTVDQRECGERGGDPRRSNAGDACSSTKERISPPLLRLDALDSILDTKEWASPAHCSSHPAAILSAASTRAAPEHLPTFLSARGSTSRASARHGSGRSARTGRTTQRDITSPRESPVSEGVGLSVDHEAGVIHPARLPSTVDRGEVVAVHHEYGAAAKRDSLDLSNGGSSEHGYRRTGTMMFDGDVNNTAVVSSGRCEGICSRASVDCPTNLVLNLARDSARGRALSDSSPPRRQESHLGNPCVLFEAKVSVARLLASLLPLTPIEHNPKESLVAALDVLSFAGTLSWIDERGFGPCCSDPELGQTRSHHNTISGTGRESSPAVWAPELERIDVELLVQAARMHLDRRIAFLQSQSQRDCRGGENGTGTASSYHQSRVHKACLMGAECVWLTRLLLNRMIAASALDGEWRSALAPKATAGAVRFCGHALKMLPRSLHSLSSCHSPVEHRQGLSKDSHEVPLESTAHVAEFLLLTAPMVVDIAEMLIVLMGKSTAWGENLPWAVQTLSLAAFCPDGNGAMIPACVDLLTYLVGSVPAEDGSSGHGADKDQQQRQLCASRNLREAVDHLEMGLNGRKAILQQVLTALVDGVTAILLRAKTLLETSFDNPQNTLETAAPELDLVNEGITAVREAVSQVSIETALLFRHEGPVLSILKAELPVKFVDQAESPAATLRQASPASSVTSTACLAATLRLSTAFFSLYGKGALSDERGLQGLQAFVAPLFSGFRQRWDGMARRFKAEASDGGGHPSEEEHRVEQTVRHELTEENPGALRPKEGEREVLLCRLHLEALVEMANIPDPDVQMQLRDCRVAPFLLQRLLAVDGGAAGTSAALLESPLSAHGSLVHSSSCGALISQKSQPSNASGHPSSGAGSGGISPVVQPGMLVKSDRRGSGGFEAKGTTRPSGTISTKVADGAKSFSAGDQVDGLVSVKSGRPRWFPGQVKSIHDEDGTLHVCYDDGDEESRKDPAKVRPRRTRTVNRRSVSRIQNRPRWETAAMAMTAAAPVLRRNQDGEEMAATPERLTPGHLELRSSAADSSRPQTDIVGMGLGKKRVSTGDLSSSSKGRIVGVDGDPDKGAGSIAEDAEQQPQSRLSLTIDAKMMTTSNGGAFSPGAVADGADDGDSTAEDDGKDDDAYFEIPTVLDATGKTDYTFCPLPAEDPAARMSVVPRIDLQSQVFRTRVFSSQLGPGSSLSTPTTGGARVLDTLRTGRASRSEASLATAAALPSGRSSRVSRRPSMTGRLSAGSGGPSSRGFPRSASVLADSEQSVAHDGSLEREIARLLDQKPHELPSEGEDEEENDVAISTSGILRSARKSPSFAKDAYAGYDCDVVVGASPARHASLHLGNGDSINGLHGGHPPFSLARHRLESDLRAMQGCAVTVILAMATLAVTHDSPLTSAVAPREGKVSPITDAMAALERVFDSGRGAHILPTLKMRWSSGVVASADPPTAVMAKLVCPAFFDARSYALDGDHIAAGRFGGVIVSKCPIPLGGTRTSRTVAQAPFDSSSSRTTRKEHEPPLEPLLGSVPHDSRRRRVRKGGVDVDEEVALKVVEREDFDGGTRLTVFREVLALRALAGVHGVCRLYDFGATRASYVLVMERCACNLKDWRIARGANGGDGNDDIEVDDDRVSPEAPCSDEEVALYLRVFRQVVSAVAAMAERGVIHFDLKCDNILVRNSSSPDRNVATPATSTRGRTALTTGQYSVPSVCVADFGESVIGRRQRPRQPQRQAGTDPAAEGSARPAEGRASCGELYFDIHGARGTERIQSPEMIVLAGAGAVAAGARAPTASVAQGGEEAVGTITAAADIWSLGCLLYELLTSKLLFGDLEWSEFFVMLTAGEAAISRVGESKVNEAPVTPVQTLPSPKSLIPFTALGSAETLRHLLEAMLIRNPAYRPSASQVVRYVDEALEVVIFRSSKVGVGADKSPRVNKSCWGQRRSSFSTSPDEKAGSILCRKTAELRDDVSKTSQEEQGAFENSSPRQTQSETPTGENQSMTDDNATTNWALLQPSLAVVAHRDFAAKRVALEGCDGVISRLGAGASLLALESSIKGGDRVDTDCAAAAWQRLGPETSVCSLTAASCGDCRLMANRVLPSAASSGLSRCSLGNALSALGIAHVVCVILKRGGGGYTQHCSSGTEQSPLHPSRLVDSRESEGPRIMKVHVSVGDTEQEESSRTNSQPSAPSSVKAVVRDVLEFATGHRVIFVGVDCERDVAGAVAVAWAMNRTGKGAYETILKFRQECAGFWVDLATLKSVIGETMIL